MRKILLRSIKAFADEVSKETLRHGRAVAFVNSNSYKQLQYEIRLEIKYNRLKAAAAVERELCGLQADEDDDC